MAQLGHLKAVEMDMGDGLMVHVFAVKGAQTAIVDSAWSLGFETLLEGLHAIDVNPASARCVINTHEHVDHIGGNSSFEQQFHLPFASHEEARRYIEDYELQFRHRPSHMFWKWGGEPVRVQHALKEGDRVDLGGGVSLEVFHTPGHSPGSMSLLVHPDRTLLTADLLQPLGRRPIYEDGELLRASHEKIRRLVREGSVTTIWPSHEPPAEGRATMDAIIDRSLEFVQRTHEAALEAHRTLGAGQPLREYAAHALKRLGLDPPPLYWIVLSAIMHHLRRAGIPVEDPRPEIVASTPRSPQLAGGSGDVHEC